ncbi:type IV secretory system conjugative DNA transfer family protein [Vibrio anguillarum]|uniref:type IV secretory system conjugative DNA transfer family protein n=1 Tax=Vibrio anguillarum TaxID=55601 RepID=UPI001D18067B|nr:type IV secretory system conjugative DNA transfer family protein [Vibrio anguillarum]MCC4238131.1 type IV secretory system conjugative DNA transfer family protein [Vibrio anguillarum]
MEPINNNNKLDNNHAYVVGMSGSGKSSLAKKLLIQATDQVAIYDPKREYDGRLCGRVVRVYTNLFDFGKAIIAGRKTNRGFKIAYRPKESSPKDFDSFCRVVWSVGNGKHKKALKVICEEVAENSTSAGKATGYHGKLLRLGRSYNIHTINLFQRGQEVSKTIIDNCEYGYVMLQKTDKSRKYLEDMTGISVADQKKLKKFEYYKQYGVEAEKGVIRW